MPFAAERTTLVKAIASVVEVERQTMARRFLQGLSTDELRYFASYLGACMIETALRPRRISRRQIAWEILQYECCRRKQCALPGCGGPGAYLSDNVQHKMILLLEYLTSCQCSVPVPVPAASA